MMGTRAGIGGRSTDHDDYPKELTPYTLANFVLPPGGVEPDSIRFSLSVDGHEPGAKTYDDGMYAPGEPTRIARVWHWGVPHHGTRLRNVTYTMD